MTTLGAESTNEKNYSDKAWVQRLFSKHKVASARELLPVFPPAASVPRIIHQVYYSRILPQVIQENVAKMKALNPGWEYRFYDDDDMADFIKLVYGDRILGYYNRINPKYGASRADLFRYLLMHKVGGVYLDIKSSLDRPFDQVLRSDDVYLLSRWRNGKGERHEGWGKHAQLKNIGGEEFQQWHIVAAPGHPFLRAVIEHVLCNIDDYNPLLHDTGKGGVLRVTGPIAYTRSITPLLNRHQHRIVDSEADVGLIYSIYGAASHQAHKSIFNYHYTELKEPVTQLHGMKKLLWLVFGPIHAHVIVPARNIMGAIARHLPNNSLRRG